MSCMKYFIDLYNACVNYIIMGEAIDFGHLRSLGLLACHASRLVGDEFSQVRSMDELQYRVIGWEVQQIQRGTCWEKLCSFKEW